MGLESSSPRVDRIPRMGMLSKSDLRVERAKCA